MSMVADRYVPREQTSDPDLRPVTITRLPDGVEVSRCPVTQNLMIDALGGVAELTPAAEAALLAFLMLDGA